MYRCSDDDFVVFSTLGDLFGRYAHGLVFTVRSSSECYARGTFSQAASCRLFRGLSRDAGRFLRKFGLPVSDRLGISQNVRALRRRLQRQLRQHLRLLPRLQSICSSCWCLAFDSIWDSSIFLVSFLFLVPLNIQPVVVVRGLWRQQAAALTNFVGCFLLALFYFFFFPPSS